MRLAVVLFALLATVAVYGLAPPCTLDETVSDIRLSNGYTAVVFDKLHPSLSEISGDFLGGGQYVNALSSSASLYVLEREDGSTTYSSAQQGAGAHLSITVLANTSSLVSVRIGGIVDDVSAAVVSEEWTLTLQRGQRNVVLSITGSTVRAASYRAIRHSAYLQGSSITAFYNRGVVQMKNAPPAAYTFGSVDQLHRVYSLGNGNALDIIRTDFWTSGAHTCDISVLMCTEGGKPFWTALQGVVVGGFGKLDVWADNGWPLTPVVAVPAGVQWRVTTQLYPNSDNFPVSTLPADATTPNLPTEDLRALMLGIYPGIVGCLNSYDPETPGQVAPSIHAPMTAYGNTYNYFDPDNYIGMSAMVFSGDSYLQEQARLVIERSGSFLLPSGQLPHHFEWNKPTYIALSGATQTGPNLFWTLTAYQYAKVTGNKEWLAGYMPTLRRSVQFLLGFLNTTVSLLNVPGSLMIDVFIRQQFASDSNAMIVGLLNEAAEAELALGFPSNAAALTTLAGKIAAAVNEHLWDGVDHYITQRNLDGSIRDFVDYDSNLIAVATGVASVEQAEKVFAKVDAGRCTHGRATFVSELYYGPSDCFKENVGDSWCSMGRIGWFDSLARRRMGDQKTFDDILLNPLRDDLLANTWLRERYSCDGTQQLNRTQYYFEYPAVVSMLLRQVRYGVNLELRNVTIAPFGPTAFSYHIGDVNVDYAPSAVTISVPNGGAKVYRLERLLPVTKFALTVCGAEAGAVTSDQDGTVVFTAATGCVVSLNKV
eukprot:TRINITY_DN12839_c0_g1_i1.p1 TRINITY_DN12839_c0_g1~~TRINITY_DN12839_c0_g1_i1.p1  ORF type:complete len:766 (-),score=178.45 TRINITY_DN12839_c0_g1_i1:39-2336(-)